MSELRPVPATDRETCQRMLQYAFAPETVR